MMLSLKINYNSSIKLIIQFMSSVIVFCETHYPLSTHLLIIDITFIKETLCFLRNTMSSIVISEYHAHIYFEEQTLQQAIELCQTISEKFNLVMGRVHQRPVGPHCSWSCLVKFPVDLFAELIPWLMLNRNELTIFVHPETGNDLKDHTRHAMWLGPSKLLNLNQFISA